MTIKTKIVATVGPASSSKDMLRELIKAGVNVFRLNFSHSKHEEHLLVINNLNELNEELGTHVAILADLQGPKLRVGEMENNGVMLEPGAEFEFVTEKCIGTSKKAYMSYQQFPQDVAHGDLVLIDDGKLKLEVVSTNRKDSVIAKVIYGGKLSSKKGVNLPNTKISLPSLTEKDQADAEFALDHDVDWIALSFVRCANDITDLKKLIKNKGKHTKVIAKIEKPEAIAEIHEIIHATDGVMVARGDLGVELPFAEVPMMQKMIVNLCVKHAKPVIIATQMMESMITNFNPTRAEANDVANAVLDGASALMLSGETSVGLYPIEVITSMKNIINVTEQKGYSYYREHLPSTEKPTFVPDAVCWNACNMVQQSGAKLIVAMTYSGYTAFRIASHRPNASIITFTPLKGLLRQLSLVWGVKAFYSPEFLFTNDALEFTLQFMRDNSIGEAGDMVVHVGSVPLNKKGHANMAKFSML